MASIKVNLVWNSLRTATTLLFPLITFPYISRVLGPENVGLFTYVTAISAYFCIFATMGFPLYGIREIANVKDDPKKFETIVCSIFSINAVFSTLVFLIYLIFSYVVSGENFVLYFIVGLSILFSCISFNWFYQGIEDFRYITVVSVFVKSFALICLIVFVDSKTDLLAYAVITIFATCGNYIINLIRIRRYAKLHFTLKDAFKHIKGASYLFLGTIAVSLYTNLNSIMIGAFSSMVAVGYFTSGNKIVQILLTVIATITTTLIPRMSYLVENGKEEDALKLQIKAINLINYLSFPLVAGLIIFAKPIVLLLCGEEFLPSVEVLRILSLLLIIIPWSSFLGFQILYPVKKEKLGGIAVFIGAIVNLVCNYFFITKYGYIGVCISVILAETVITVAHYVFSLKYMRLRLIDFIPIKAIIATIVMAILIFYLLKISDDIIFVLIWSVIGAIVYFVSLLLLRDKFIKEVFIKSYIQIRK